MFSKFYSSKKKETIERNILNEPSSLNESNVELEEKEEEVSEPKDLFTISNHVKSNKELMDLMLAVEQVVHQQQITDLNFNELQNRSIFTLGQLTEQEKENRRINLVLKNKDTVIGELENKISDKNLKFDQVMEDFNVMKSQLSNEIDKLKNLVDIEQKKYKSLNEQYEKELVDWVNKVKMKEEMILDLESRNANYREQNAQISKENKYLLTMANDFTSRMSASFLDYKTESEENEKNV